MNVQELIKSRQNIHGDFRDNARVAQAMKRLFRREAELRAERGQMPLTDTQMDALDMIAAKVGRIFAGVSGHHDHWDDIAGYATIAVHPAANNESE